MSETIETETIETETIEDEFKAPVLKDIKYPITLSQIDNLLEEYSDIPNIDPDGENVEAEFNFVLKGHQAFVKARNTIERIRKELKAPSLEYGRRVDGIAKEFQAKITKTEQALFIQRKVVEDNEKRKEEEYARAEEIRRDAIRSKIEVIKNLPLDHFNSSSLEFTKVLESLRPVREEEYQEFLEEAQNVLTLTISQLQQGRDNRVKSEQAEKIQAENEMRLAEEQRIKDEAIAKERAEFEAEKEAIQRERDDMQRQKDELQEQINLQNAEIEAERLSAKQAEEQRRQAEEQQRRQAEEQRRQAEEQRRQAEEQRRQAEANEKARQAQKVQDAKDKELKAKQTKELYDKIEAQIGMFKTARDVLNAIIDEKIDHIRWEV